MGTREFSMPSGNARHGLSFLPQALVRPGDGRVGALLLPARYGIVLALVRVIVESGV